MALYRIEIDSYSTSGRSWQTMHTELMSHDGSPQVLAEITAQSQNIADGDDWRVCVYSAMTDDMVGEAGPGAV